MSYLSVPQAVERSMSNLWPDIKERFIAGKPKIDGEGITQYLADMGVTAKYSGQFSWLAAILVLSTHDKKDPDSFANPISVERGPLRMSSAAESRSESSAEIWDSRVFASDIVDSPWWVNYVGWNEQEGSETNINLFVQDHTALMDRRIKSLTRTAEKLSAWLNQPHTEQTKKPPTPGNAPSGSGKKGSGKASTIQQGGKIKVKELSLAAKGNMLGLGMLGGMVLLWLATRKKG